MGAACHTGNRTISTHSLTRRLTSLRVDFLSHVMHFNSQPHKEADSVVNLLFIISAYFNSQPHKEADVSCNLLKPPKSHFNSQPHKEADDTKKTSYTLTGYFNSQPHKEADPEPPEITFSENTFQLTASQGG